MILNEQETKAFYECMGVDLNLAKDLVVKICDILANKDLNTALCALSKVVGVCLNTCNDLETYEKFFQEHLILAIKKKNEK